MRRSQDVLLAGYFGFGNIGDEWIADAFSRELAHITWRKLVPDPGPLEINRWNPLSLWRALRSSRALVLGGGELFQTLSSSRSLYYYLGLMQLARAARCPVYLYGVAIDPGMSQRSFRWLKRALSQASFLSVRDSRSAQGLIDHGFGSVHHVPDAAWTTPIPPPTGVGRGTAWILRWDNSHTQSKFPGFLNGALRDEAGPTLFIPFQRSTEEISLDHFCRKLSIAHEVVLADAGNVWETLRTCARVVTQRFHGLVAAALLKKPALAVPLSDKVREAAREWGVPILELNTLTPTLLPEALAQAKVPQLDVQGQVRGAREALHTLGQLLGPSLEK